MNKILKQQILLIIIALAIGLFTSCSSGDGSDSTRPAGAGDIVFDSVNGVSFNMVYVPAMSFKTGTDDSGADSVANPYLIGETEVTYELWNTVRTWAVSNGYIFANAGVQGKDGSGSTSNQHPVTTINWRDAMVWSNALTEYYNSNNGTSLKLVYYTDSSYTMPHRDSSDATCGGSVGSTNGDCDNPYIYSSSTGNLDIANNTAEGFRLPTTQEWELAARYKADSNGDGDIQDAGEYYPGNYASGDSDPYDTSSTLGNYVVYSLNSGSMTAAVKSKTANALGIYDMCGNVSNWIFDWHPSTASTRVRRGGHYDSVATAFLLEIGHISSLYPYDEYSTIGFRLSRSAP